MSRPVWLVSSGEYSDYHVDERAFATEGDAQAYVDAGHAERVEGAMLYPAGYRARVTIVFIAETSNNPYEYAPKAPEVRVVEARWIDDDGAIARRLARPRTRVSMAHPESEAGRRGDWMAIAEGTDREATIKACSEAAAPLEWRGAQRA